jgi:hypothetical protein
MRSDVAEHVAGGVAGQNGRDRKLPDEELEALVGEVMSGHTYRKLSDRFVELGNQLLADAAAAIGTRGNLD